MKQITQQILMDTAEAIILRGTSKKDSLAEAAVCISAVRRGLGGNPGAAEVLEDYIAKPETPAAVRLAVLADLEAAGYLDESR